MLRLEVTNDLEMLPDNYAEIPPVMMKWGLHKEPQECVWVVAIGAELDVRTVVEIARGSQVKAKVHFPTLIAAVVTAGCERFMLVHNHPSNHAGASPGDIELTKGVMAAANAAGLYFEDHIILTPGGTWHSMALSGQLVPQDYVKHASAASRTIRVR